MAVEKGRIVAAVAILLAILAALQCYMPGSVGSARILTPYDVFGASEVAKPHACAPVLVCCVYTEGVMRLTETFAHFRYHCVRWSVRSGIFGVSAVQVLNIKCTIFV